MDDACVLACLAEHLTLGGIVRLHEALCVRDGASREMVGLARQRLGVTRGLGGGDATTFARMVGRRMTRATARCRECGGRCARRCRVCHACANDATSFVCLVSRDDLCAGEGLSRGVVARRMLGLRVVARTAQGAHLYWRADAIERLTPHARATRPAPPP